MHKVLRIWAAVLVWAVVVSGAAPLAQSGQVKGSEVLIIGDSYFALSGAITVDLIQHARTDGILSSADKFRDVSISGTWIDPKSTVGTPIPKQYANAKAQSPVKWVIMDGGGNDCLQGTCPTPYASSCQTLITAVNALNTLLGQMKDDGVKGIIFLSYPHFTSNMNGIEDKYNILRPMLQGAVEKWTSPPPCYWFDLGPIFGANYSKYSSDGIHPSATGSQIVADSMWKLIKVNNFFGGTSIQIADGGKNASSLRCLKTISRDQIQVSLSTAYLSSISMRLYTLWGRTVTSTNKSAVSGFQTFLIPLNAAAPGVYFLEINAGGMLDRSEVLVR